MLLALLALLALQNANGDRRFFIVIPFRSVPNIGQRGLRKLDSSIL